MKLGFNKLAVALGASCVIAAPFAAADDHKFELNVGGGYYYFENDRPLDNDPLWGAGLGYRLNPNWTMEAWWTDSNLKSDPGNIDIGGEEIRLDMVYNFAESEGITPYIVFGAGEMTYDTSAGDSDETRINFGFGLKKAITERLKFRGDLRMFNSLDNELTDTGVLVGVNYALGRIAPKVVDSDGDGVPDDADACANTPAGVSVDSRGCPSDSDGDGVADYLDKCPGTDANLKVDANGCPLSLEKTVSTELKVNFDNNSDVIKPVYHSEIKRVAEFMREYGDTNVEIQGHSDSYGTDAYNLDLSQRRADAVARVLVEEFGINSNRVTAKGYGEAQLIASDATNAGRIANRRVVAEISARVKTMQKR